MAKAWCIVPRSTVTLFLLHVQVKTQNNGSTILCLDFHWKLWAQ